MRLKYWVFPLFVALSLVFIPSCDESEKNSTIEVATQASVTIALDAWALKGSTSEATLAAQLIVTNATACQTWLAGNPTPLGTDVENLLNTVLLKNVDPIIAEAITLASAVLDDYMPTIPTSAMSSDYVAYVQSFLTGCIAGANDSTVGPTATAGTTAKVIQTKTKTKKSVWFPKPVILKPVTPPTPAPTPVVAPTASKAK
jgi:hypothetical protein